MVKVEISGEEIEFEKLTDDEALLNRYGVDSSSLGNGGAIHILSNQNKIVGYSDYLGMSDSGNVIVLSEKELRVLSGEWINEADDVQFTYKNYLCNIHRDSKGGFLYGFVEVEQDNVFYGLEDVYSCPIKVHGGVTCSIKSKRPPFNKWLIGFDCAHDGDLAPDLEFSTGTYKNIEFVTNEIHKMVDQIIILNQNSQMEDK